MYNPKKDKALNTSKKKVRDDGTCNQPNPPKELIQYIHNVNQQYKKFNRVNSIKKIQQGKFSMENWF